MHCLSYRSSLLWTYDINKNCNSFILKKSKIVLKSRLSASKIVVLAKHQGQGANITVSTGQSLNSWALRVHGVKAQLRYQVTTKSTGHTVQCTPKRTSISNDHAAKDQRHKWRTSQRTKILNDKHINGPTPINTKISKCLSKDEHLKGPTT